MDNLDHIRFHESTSPELRAELMEYGELYGIYPSNEEATKAILSDRLYGWFVTANDDASGQCLLFRRANPDKIKAA